MGRGGQKNKKKEVTNKKEKEPNPRCGKNSSNSSRQACRNGT